MQDHILSTAGDAIRASPPTLSMRPCENMSHIQVLVDTNFFPTPPIKVKLGVLVDGRLLIATHLDQSNYLANQKQRTVNKYDLTLFITLFQASSRALEGYTIFRLQAVFGCM